jgi:hypothetical protein
LLLVLILLLLLGALLLLFVLVLLLGVLLLVSLLLLRFLLLRLCLLLRFVLFVVLLILLSVSKGSGSEKHKQNCCADDSNGFHECCLNASLRATGTIKCLLLTNGERMGSSCARAGSTPSHSQWQDLSVA